MKLFCKIVLCVLGFAAFCIYCGEICWPEEAFVRPTTIWRPDQNTTWTKTVWPNYGEVPASPPSSLFMEFPGPVWISPPLILMGAPVVVSTSGTVIANRVIDARGAKNGISILAGVDNTIIRGCKVSGASEAGIRAALGSLGLTIEDCEVTSNGASGIASHARTVRIVNNRVHHNGKIRYGALWGFDCAGIAVSTGTVAAWIEGNECWENGEWRWKADPEISVIRATGPVIVRGNDIHEAVHGGILLLDVERGGLIEYNTVSGAGTVITTMTARSGCYSSINVDAINLMSKGIVIKDNIIVRQSRPVGASAAALSCYSAFVMDLWVFPNMFAQNARDVEWGTATRRTTWRIEE